MLKAVVGNTTELHPQSNAALVDCYDGGDAEEDREPYGKIPMMCDLHSISIPCPPTQAGKAELLASEVAGRNGAIVGGWDTRLASMAGELGPGDACSFAPHPNQAVRVLYKGDGRAWAVVVESKGGDQLILSLAGKEGFGVQAFGHAMKVDKKGFSICSSNGKNTLSVTDSEIALTGNVTAGPPGVPGETLAVASVAVWSALAALAGGALRPVFSSKVGG